MKVVYDTVRFIIEILPDKYRLKLLGVGLLLLLNSILELIGLGAMLPVFSVLLEENVIDKYVWASWVYDTFGLTDERQLIIALAIGLFIIILIKNLLSLWITKTNSTFSLTLFKELSLRLHQLYYRRGFIFFKNNSSSIIVRNLRAATENFSTIQLLGVMTFLNELVVLLLIVTFIAVYNLQILGLLIITVLPPFLVFYRWVRTRSIILGEIKNRIDPIIWKNNFQSIFGFVDVTISGAEKVFRKRIEENLDELVEVNIKTNIYNLAPTRVIETSLMLAIAVMVTFGLYILPSKMELLKILGLFAVAGYRIMPSINRMMIAMNGLNRSHWVFDILEPLKKEEKELNIKEKPIEFSRCLSLQNISFSYSEDSEKIFENYSIAINKGEVIGLVGPSGAGKTTLMNILLGFLKPTQGVYKVDNTILTEAHLKAFYHKVGYVQQQVYLLDGTVAENVAFGVDGKDVDQTKLRKVLEKASLWETVENLPNGINEILGENGTRLSGGQRQRVGIARALYSDAEILFFDEATSSLDTQTEQEITDAIANLQDGRLTMIIIAHRRSTLESCNRIIEINQSGILQTSH